MSATTLAAVEAARVALAIASSYETSQSVVLRSSQYIDALAATQAALTASQHPSINYAQAIVEASYGIHGSHLDDDVQIEAREGHYLTVIVKVDVQSPISDLTLIPVISSLACEVELAALENDSYVAQVIYILNEPTPAMKAA